MKNYITAGLLLFTLSLCSQPVLRLDEAIGIALEQNFGIQIAMLEQKADQMQVYKANAGMSPEVDWNLNYSMSASDVKQRFVDGTGVNRQGRAFNPATNVSLRLTLFNGGLMQATYDRLGLLSQYTDLQGKVIIQNTIVDVMEAYYNIIQQKERVAFLNTIILFYEERLKITEERWQVGQGSKLDYLQSKTDLNVQLSEMVGVKNNLKNTKVILNGLLNREPSEDFDVEDVNNSESEYILAELKKIATEKNRDLMLLQKALHISQKQEEEREALLKPEVILNGNVGFAYSNTNAGFFLSNRSLSATAGVSARWNLIDGKHRKTQIAIAKVNTEIIEKEQESLEAQIFTDLTFAYNQYESDKELVAFEKENKLVAEENLSISIEKFRLGGSTILELSEAQRAYDTALNRLVNAQYNIKISELELLRLSGVLVQ